MLTILPCFYFSEIIQAAKESPQELQGFLGETSSKDITVKCFDEALVEACYVGMFDSVCMLLVAGATNIRECIAISIKNGHYRVTVLLLICYAAIAENISMLETLLDENSNCQTYLEQFLDQSLPMETVIGRIRQVLIKFFSYHYHWETSFSSNLCPSPFPGCNCRLYLQLETQDLHFLQLYLVGSSNA